VKKHYTLGPSAAPAWSRCPAKPTREHGIPNESSPFADWGTVAHDLAEKVLLNAAVPLVQDGSIHGQVQANGSVFYAPVEQHKHGRALIALDAEMWQCVNTYVEFVRAIPGERLIEVRVPVDHITGEEGASGTSDAVVLSDTELVVVDLKGGQGVRVDAYEEGDVDVLTGEVSRRPNDQLAMYAGGALREVGWMGEFKTVRMVIVQPRLNHVSEHVMTVAELEAHLDYLRERAEATRDPLAPAVPGDKQCKFCRAKATCPELQAVVLTETVGVFDDLDAAKPRPLASVDLSQAMRLIPLIESWCESVRAKVFADLQAGVPHEGWKLVTGRRGARRWTDEAIATDMLRNKFRLPIEKAFDMTLISPTKAEEVLAKEHPRQWKQLLPLITQPDGKPSVAPESDKRPALVVQAAADAFSDLTTPGASDPVPDSLSDLF
jgi:CRISPR/Cas system-associated exonuclease Cas4 (RecB family)